MTTLDNYYDAVRAYTDMLDEVYGDIEVCGMTYEAGRVLRDVDPVAYRCGFIDWCDAEGFDTDEWNDLHNAPA